MYCMLILQPLYDCTTYLLCISCEVHFQMIRSTFWITKHTSTGTFLILIFCSTLPYMNFSRHSLTNLLLDAFFILKNPTLTTRHDHLIWLTFLSGVNVTLIKIILEWLPSESQLGDHFLCAVAVNSQDVFSAPLCAIFRVFGVNLQVSGHHMSLLCI